MTVYVCPTRDIVCGNHSGDWCDVCPKRKPVKVEIQDAELGDLVRTMRLSKKLSQAALAGLVKLERTSITNIEGGKQRLMFETLQQIADHCDFELVLTIKRKQPSLNGDTTT